MSLPDGFIDELRSRLSLAQVVGRKVAWDTHRSNQAKGDYWAPCPFHQEKTASFHVDDRKGFYYCFGCHAKGDAISFVRETENVGFVEAIEILAREAGMPLPERDPRAQQKADRRGQLAEVMEQAVRHYRLQLQTAGAGAARDYLARRGLDSAALDRWEIGFAPNARRGVIEALTARGVDEGLVVDAGLAKREGGEPAFDRFRGRIMFPIRDARGRAIAFGGRAMDPAARAKYLNSPQTELFDKGRSLFNQGPAREAAGRGAPLVVAEGYMDVITLCEGGFPAAVAPLGTAITEEQLRLLWRIHPEPIVALDGDVSGLNAAMRLMDLALPLIEAGQSLRFALMPSGKDPDDLIRGQGADAMKAVLDAAEPMVALLWRRETEGKTFDSPERRAALDLTLNQAVRKIRDPRLRAHYTDELKRLRWELLNPRRPRTEFRKRSRAPMSRADRARMEEASRFGQAQRPAAMGSALVTGGDALTEATREAVILATLIRHPSLVTRFVGEIERVEMADAGNEALRTAILGADPDAADLWTEVAKAVGRAALERLHEAPHVRLSPGLGEDAERGAVCVAEQLAMLSSQRGVRRELEEAMGQAETVDEHVVWRIARAGSPAASRRREDGLDEYEVAENGVRLSRRERAEAKAVFDAIDFRGGRRGRH